MSFSVEFKALHWFRRRRRATTLPPPNTDSSPLIRDYHGLNASNTEQKSRLRTFISQRRQSWPWQSTHTSTAPSTSPVPQTADPGPSLELPPPYSLSNPNRFSSITYEEFIPSASRSFTPRRSPPPVYRPLPPVQQQRPATTEPLSPSVELQRLAAVLVLHPWRASWGPRPTSLAGALKSAAYVGNQRLVRTLLDAGAEIKSNQHCAIQTSTAVHEALRGPSPQLALDLISHVAVSGQVEELLESRDEAGCTPLHIAAEAGETAIARELIQLGAAVDSVDRIGRTALHMAARYGRVETVDMLLDYGADLTLVHRQVWWRAGDAAQSQLGSYSLVSQILQDALERKTGESQAQPTNTTDDQPENQEPLPNFAQQPRMEMEQSQASRARNSWAPTTQSDRDEYASSINMRRLSLPPDQPPPLSRASSLRPSVTFSTITHPPERDPTPWTTAISPPRQYPGSLHRRSHSEQGPGRRLSIYGTNLKEVEAARRVLAHRAQPFARKPPQSFLNTPEYAMWRRNCETLQAESKAQRERNRREDRIGLTLC
ncbi:ankyrin repeat-containing domain protein [Cercophora scortea]|uniref:Ankyrin repeat-containing domain protein n=1 Tax=Cercophora scortea TaxID=314031 RepID=A0AAE0I3H7_9PEZI|nr:ankyrin repeat-containing domain protein [Cercophora scortea]